MLKRLIWEWVKRKGHKKQMAEIHCHRAKLKHLDFAIVANNCWGAEVYKYYELPFNTPFIGLFLYPDCYLKLLENWDSVNLLDIDFTRKSKYVESEVKYPVGLLSSGIEVHFLHYKDEQEAEDKWKRRASRLLQYASQPEKIFFRFCDRDGASVEHFNRFFALPFSNKVAFSARFHHLPQILQAEPQPGTHQVKDGLQSFHTELKNGFNLAGWLNGDAYR